MPFLSSRHTPWQIGFVVLLAAALSACMSVAGEDVGVVQGELSGQNMKGPPKLTSVAARVWDVKNQWSDTTTPDAQAAGPGWGAQSGLSWEDKFRRWVASFEQIADQDDSNTTVRIPTPFGDRTTPAPSVECAEFAVFLRLTFASWYHLPFFMQARGPGVHGAVYAGHFGFVDASGKRLKNFPAFSSDYQDYSTTYHVGDVWPQDTALRSLHIGPDDTLSFVDDNGMPGGAGALFDEIYLNKRVGYFARLLLNNFGSVNLADEVNMFPIRAEATLPGDVLLHRYQKQGIGHTVQVLSATPLPGQHLSLVVASGNMPRRQPAVSEGAAVIDTFTTQSAGGPGVTFDGDAYAKLGGGIRRWRTPVLVGKTWQNRIPDVDVGAYIDPSDLPTIAARPERFSEILNVGSPEEQRAAAIADIENARQQLRLTPASCAARTQREDAFAALYKIAADPSIGQTPAEVDAQTRTREDYVFAELEYEASKTCCWDTATAAMASVILDFSQSEQAAAVAAKMCVEPTVFAASVDGGYEKFRQHAIAMGREAEWLAWRADEPCPQAGVKSDVRKLRSGVAFTPFCTLPQALVAGP